MTGSAAGSASALPPGPRLPRLLQTLLIVARPVRYLGGCRRRYGPVFQVRIVGKPPIVYASTADAAECVYGADKDAALRGAVREFFEPVVGARSLVCLDGEQWARHRRLLNPLLRSRVVAGFADDIAAIAAAEIDRWPTGKPIAWHRRMDAIVLEVSLTVIFGVREEGRRERLRGLLARLVSVSTAMMATPAPVHRAVIRSPVLRRLTWLPVSRAIALRRQVDDFLLAEIADRHSSPDPGAHDLLSQLVRGDAGPRLTEPEMLDELMGLMGAGHHTTATALTWAFGQLTRHQDVMARLREDLGRGREDYLDAVVMETLRVRTVVPTAMRKLARPAALGGYAVPEGWLVTPAIPLLHTDPERWPGSGAFRPERFRRDGDAGVSAPPEWMPFGGGLRMCIGQHLAILELKIVLREALTRVSLAGVGRMAERPRNRYSMLIPSRRARLIVTGRRKPGLCGRS